MARVVPIEVVVTLNTRTHDDDDAALAVVLDQWLREWQADPDSFAALEEEFTANQAPGRKDYSYGASCVRTVRRIQQELAQTAIDDVSEELFDEC